MKSFGLFKKILNTFRGNSFTSSDPLPFIKPPSKLIENSSLFFFVTLFGMSIYPSKLVFIL